MIPILPLRLHLLVLIILYLPAFSAEAEAINVAEKTITIALTQEPPSLNSMEMTDLVSFFVISHVKEGLLRYDLRGRLAPGVASDWKQEGNKMVFHLRQDANWSNGEPVTANDFVFAWRHIINPDSASRYASIFYVLKNAEKVHQRKLPPEKLGVTALDDKILVVEFESVCGFCASLMVHGAYYPVNEKFYKSQGDGYASAADAILYNGPFRIKSWVHGSSMLLTRSENYWSRDTVKLQGVNIGYITSDNRARLNLFLDNQIAFVRLGGETIKDALAQRQRLRNFVTGGMSYVRINMRKGRPGQFKEFRKALQLVIDPAVFTNRVISMPGYIPASSFFPSWLMGVNKRFKEEYPPQPLEINALQARRQLESLGENGFPPGRPLSLLTVASPTGAKIAEYFQGLIKEQLGLDIRVDQQTLKQYIDKHQKGDFDLAISSWYPDYGDVMTYADLLASWNPNNTGGYASQDYDSELAVLQNSLDPSTRMAAAARLQDLIINDVPVIPLSETGSSYLVHPLLKGIVRRVVGPDPDFTQAWIAE